MSLVTSLGPTMQASAADAPAAISVMPTMPTERSDTYYADAAALLDGAQLGERTAPLVEEWKPQIATITHEGVRPDSYGSGTSILATSDDLVRHLLGKSSGIPATTRTDASAALRTGSTILVDTAIGDLRLSLTDPRGVASSDVRRARLQLDQAQKTSDQAKSHTGNDQSAMAHLITSWRKLSAAFTVLGIDLDGDNDGDRLSNHVEFIIGSNPFNADSDDDGLSDGFEIDELFTITSSIVADSDGNGLPDGDEDPDSDGLTNRDEQAFGSAPLDADPDGDVLSDYDERRLSTDPADPDTDDDTLLDGVEEAQSLDPTKFDTDGDGVGDADELTSTVIDGPDGPGGVRAEIRGTGDLTSSADIVPVPVADLAVVDTEEISGPAYDFTLSASDAAMISAEITIPFEAARVSPEEAEIFYFDEAEGFWRPNESPAEVDAATGTVTTTVSHFSTYAVFDKGAWERRWTSKLTCHPRGTTADGSPRAIDLVLTLDSSGSMAKNDPEDRRIDAANAVLTELINGDRAAVVDFDHRGRLLEGLTGDKQALRAALTEIDSDGTPTRIGLGVEKALDELAARGRTDAIRGVILLADGAGSYDDALTGRAVADGVTISTVGLGGDTDVDTLKAIARATGGKYVGVNNADKLPEVFRDLAGGIGSTVDTTTDTDGDGLSDCLETNGILSGTGKRYVTNPLSPDTDDDGLTDREEVGEPIDFRAAGSRLGIAALTRIGESGTRAYRIPSIPVKGDSDDDGLVDIAEFDLGTNTLRSDTDWDNLGDGDEDINILTDPLSKDTDRDGYSDIYEISRLSDGFNPFHHDVRLSKATYVKQFAKGFVFGELKPDDTMAWLAGSLASSFIPAADIRDFVGSLIHSDWVGAGLSLLGVIPIAGDAATISRKIGAFLKRVPTNSDEIFVFVAKMDRLSTGTRITILRTLVGSSFSRLESLGASPTQILRLARGRTNLSHLAQITRHANHVAGPGRYWASSSRVAQNFVADLYGAAGKGQVEVYRTLMGSGLKRTYRRWDILKDGVAREVKSGDQLLSDHNRQQILADAYLRDVAKEVEEVHWHFVPSGRHNSLGASQELIDMLEEYGIKFTFHMPIER
jgi:hypothetical protein